MDLTLHAPTVPVVEVVVGAATAQHTAAMGAHLTATPQRRAARMPLIQARLAR